MRNLVYTLCVVAMAIVLSAACHENALDSRLNMSIVVPDFHELVVNYGAPITPESIEMEVAVNAKPEIIKIVKKSEGGMNAEEVCMGVVPLTDDEYKGILEFIKTADLADYQPSQDCEPLVGTTGVGITYRTTLGLVNNFNTSCELDPVINDLITEVDRIADEAIIDCPPPGVVIETEDQNTEDTTTNEDTTTEEDTTAEEEESEVTPQ